MWIETEDPNAGAGSQTVLEAALQGRIAGPYYRPYRKRSGDRSCNVAANLRVMQVRCQRNGAKGTHAQTLN